MYGSLLASLASDRIELTTLSELSNQVELSRGFSP